MPKHGIAPIRHDPPWPIGWTQNTPFRTGNHSHHNPTGIKMDSCCDTLFSKSILRSPLDWKVQKQKVSVGLEKEGER